MSLIKQAVLGVVGSKFLPPAELDRVDVINDHYWLFELASDAFKGASWEAAAKVQIDVGGWAMRTYTPIEIDPRSGRARFLAYLHGDGPACHWLRRFNGGSVVTHVAGPKASLPDVARPALFFGDETSLAAAATLQADDAPASRTPCVFEVEDMEDTHGVIRHLGLANVTLVQKRADGGHVGDIIERLEEQLARSGGRGLVLTGNGRTIQAIRSALRAGEHRGVAQRVKAYWTPGKIGLD